MRRGRRAAELGDIWSQLPAYTTAAGQLHMSGKPVRLKGVSWFGAEGAGRAPDGLWVHDINFYLSYLAEHGFNALRLPFALDNVLSDEGPDFDMVRAEPELRGMKYVEVLERVVDAAASHGILVLLDLHRLRSTSWPDGGLWYTDGVTIDTVISMWDRIQSRFCSRWNVIGADLLNEPYGARWTEWTQAAAKIGASVLSGCSRWVIFVEGVAHEGIEPDEDGDIRGEYFWGENLADAAKQPVPLRHFDKIVFSPHVYGPGRDDDAAHHMDYFETNKFPKNMESIWTRHFGYLKAAGATVIVGEWGGVFEDKDRKWQEAFQRYLLANELSSFYWALNPNSEDTGGLLTDDWTTPESAKLALLKDLPSTKVQPMLSGVVSFRCPEGLLPSNLHRCSDQGANECILRDQRCNGVFECRDRSDERMCDGVQRPCSTDTGRECVFPFTYNSFRYDGCTQVDAPQAWLPLGSGRCQQGYIPGVAAHGVSLRQCEDACARVANCSFVSFTPSKGFCGGYTAACDSAALTATTSDYATYRFNELGGTWCPTAVGASGEYIGHGTSGTCGPGCAQPPPDVADDPLRSRCVDGGAHSDGGVGHCAPSPPPPPMPPARPSSPPPAAPPLVPAPLAPSALLRDPNAAGGALFFLIGGCCLCSWVCSRLGEPPARRSRRRSGRTADERELMALDDFPFDDGPDEDVVMPARGRRDRHAPPRKAGRAPFRGSR